MTTIRTLAAEMSAAFEIRTRDNGDKLVHLRKDAPDWMYEIVRGAHGEMLPDEWRYRFIRGVVDAIADSEDLDDARDEFVDDVSVDTKNLVAWLGSHTVRAAYVDEAVEDMDRSGSIMADIQSGQSAERGEVFDLVREDLKNCAAAIAAADE